ncbi:MAG: CCA tRNA nucleotidyltransferase [Candidatus Woesearchaeota archaeon]
MKLLKEVLEGIKPTKTEEKEVKGMIKEFVDKLNKGLKEGKAVLGGSGAKETWLSDVHDADIFVQYDYNKYKDKSDKLSDILEKRLKKIFPKIKRLHGSRDYFQVHKKNFTFEIVPILKITNSKNAINITDVSPLHAVWVGKHKKYADEIRLTKKFCKAIGVYGAESYIKGFSGYMCEILTIKYKGFLGLVRNASKWGEKTVIDIEKYYRNKQDVLFNINKSKQQGPMILIDPVQKDRNAAAALDEKKYSHFIDYCKHFVKKPSKKYFEIKELDVDRLKGTVLKVEVLRGKEDVVGSKVLKVVTFLNKELLKKDFKVKGYGWHWDKGKFAYLWYDVDSKKLDSFVVKQGPPIKIENHAKKFKKMYRNSKVVKGRLIAKVKREFRDANLLLKKLIKEKYVKERVKKISFS